MQSSPVKLLIAVPNLECGGLERNVAFICNHIDTKAFDVTLAIINNSNPFYTITNPAIKVIDLQCNNVRSSLQKLVRLIKEVRPVIVLTTANHLNLLFALFRWKFPKEIKIIARESSIVSINSRRAKMPFLYNSLLKLFYRKIDIIICQSEFMKEDIIRNYSIKPSQILLIRNAVIPGNKREYPVLSGDKKANLISVGRLSEEKGIDRMIRAVALLKIPFTFSIIGSGNKKESLELLINKLGVSEKVKLEGSRQDPYNNIVRPDLFLMGSHYEGFPNVLLEANAEGIPVVAFNSPGGVGEVVVNYENGILVEDGDENAFALAIEQALNYKFDIEGIQKRTQELYGPSKIMKEWESVLKKVVLSTPATS